MSSLGLPRRARGFAGLLGIEIQRAEDGGCTCLLPLRPDLLNSGGIMHGGALATLADTAMGVGLGRSLPQGLRCATVDLHINYLRPVSRGPVSCQSRLVRRGQRLAHLSAELWADGKLVATAQGNFAIFARKTTA